MKARPILFSAPMVRALLDGSKTQTRRAIKGVLGSNCLVKKKATKTKCGIHTHVLDAADHGLCPYGQPGDLLYVRETHKAYTRDSFEPKVFYRATDGEVWPHIKWKPSIFMYRWMSRLTLKITDVRVERLQDISEDDAKAEGCGNDEDPYWQPSYADPDSGGNPSFKLSYEYLWDSINGNWNDNPWVWVVEFEVIHKNVDEVLTTRSELKKAA